MTAVNEEVASPATVAGPAQTASTEPASAAPASQPPPVQQVALTTTWGRRTMERITDVTGFTSSGLILLGVAVVSWLVGYYVGGRPLFLMSYGAVGVLIVSWFYGRRAPDLTGTDRAATRP